jgi:aminopeptidase N
MENPCLTFVTPTLLTGDRSATNVVAHEIAHSWTGNLVTNASWEHFWLNEGWTVWPCLHASLRVIEASNPMQIASGARMKRMQARRQRAVMHASV